MSENPMAPFRQMAGKSPEDAKFFWSGGPIEVAPRAWFQSYLSGAPASRPTRGWC